MTKTTHRKLSSGGRRVFWTGGTGQPTCSGATGNRSLPGPAPMRRAPDNPTPLHKAPLPMAILLPYSGVAAVPLGLLAAPPARFAIRTVWGSPDQRLQGWIIAGFKTELGSTSAVRVNTVAVFTNIWLSFARLLCHHQNSSFHDRIN